MNKNILLAVMLIIFGGNVYAKEIPQEVFCVIGEAEGEGYTGMLAVAEAIRNRGSLKGVYGCFSPRVKENKYSVATLKLALQAWVDSEDSNITKGATHWEGTAFKTPYWAKGMTVTATIGRQRFYKEKANAKNNH